MFTDIALFGLGLLGGSICRALKKIQPGVRIHAYGRQPGKLEPALRSGFVDSIAGFDGISLSGIDLAVVSTPVHSSIEIISRILSAPDIGPKTVVIDVGSVKERIIRSVEGLARAGQFIGCHPMAGSEKMGYEHSRDDLFSGASVIITPHGQNSAGDVAAVRRFWESLGARTVEVTPEAHDLVVTYTSHLPHLVACSLVQVFSGFLAGQDAPGSITPFIGNGFRDTTRVASGSPDMWRDISLMNRDNIIGAIDRLVAELGRFRTTLSESGADAGGGPLCDYFAGAKSVREGLK